MNILYKKSWLFICTVFFCGAAFAQQDWPKNITGTNGDLIKIYQPQVESYSNNTIKSRSAVSVVQSGKTDPVFGAFWWDANVNDNGQTVSIQSMQVNNIKFPDGIDDDATAAIKNAIESAMPQMNISLSKDELQSSLRNTQDQERLSNNFDNSPPKIIFTTKPSMLVLIDGQPKLQSNSTYGVDAVVNSPFTIVKNNDGRFYLYGGKQWYTAASATGPYSYVSTVPDNLVQIENAAKSNQNKSNDDNNSDAATSNSSNIIPEIIVSTEPAELIQSDGEANFAPVENTSLLYVKNSSNDIFMDVPSQQYYVLLSGRWYKTSNLKGQWQFISADKLPGDFAKIPAGSAKDNVLASVAGTDQADEAVMDAAIPQTAKVDRKTATTNVSYDGDPQFENINGTRLQYAVNASATVLKIDGMYFAVDNGVWYQSNGASGPWQVSTTRPADLDRIPPSYPVYNSKYVYVYDATPDYVYTGYTPGYLNAYVYGPTLVYGTGYYYRPWYRHRYYARPYTWGFGMNYTPWYGYGFGYGFGYNWFDIGFGYSSWWGGGFGIGFGGGWGWWGPSYYRPSYAFGRSYYHNYGYYGYNRGFSYRNSVRINYRYNNNIYNGRRSVVSYNNRSFVNNNRYSNNYNRNGAFNNRNNRYDGNRGNNNGFNNGNGGNRAGGNNNGFNNGRRNDFQNQSNNGNYNRYNNPNNRPGNNNDANGNGGRRGFGQRQNNPGGNDNNQNTRPPSFNNNGGNTGRNYSQGQNTLSANGQQPIRQREYNPQRSIDNNSNRGFSRPQQSQGQGFERPQRSSAPSSNFGGGGGNRSFGGGDRSGGGNRGGGDGGSRGGGGGNRGGGGRGH